MGTEARHCKSIPGGDADFATEGFGGLAKVPDHGFIARNDQRSADGDTAIGDRRPAQFFADIAVEVTRVYDPRELAESARGGDSCCASDCCATPGEWDASAYSRFAAAGGRLVSAFVRARKP